METMETHQIALSVICLLLAVWGSVDLISKGICWLDSTFLSNMPDDSLPALSTPFPRYIITTPIRDTPYGQRFLQTVCSVFVSLDNKDENTIKEKVDYSISITKELLIGVEDYFDKRDEKLAAKTKEIDEQLRRSV